MLFGFRCLRFYLFYWTQTDPHASYVSRDFKMSLPDPMLCLTFLLLGGHTKKLCGPWFKLEIGNPRDRALQLLLIGGSPSPKPPQCDRILHFLFLLHPSQYLDHFFRPPWQQFLGVLRKTPPIVRIKRLGLPMMTLHQTPGPKFKLLLPDEFKISLCYSFAQIRNRRPVAAWLLSQKCWTLFYERRISIKQRVFSPFWFSIYVVFAYALSSQRRLSKNVYRCTSLN